MIGELARDSFRAATRGWDFDKSTETVKFVMTWLSRRKIGRLATLVELGKSDTDSIFLTTYGAQTNKTYYFHCRTP
jgi:hypothetical protein